MPDVLEELVNNSFSIDGHRTLMSTVMQGVRFIQSGLNDASQGLLTGFEVSQVMLFPHNAVVVVSLGRLYTEQPPRLCKDFKENCRGSNSVG